MIVPYEIRRECIFHHHVSAIRFEYIKKSCTRVPSAAYCILYNILYYIIIIIIIHLRFTIFYPSVL